MCLILFAQQQHPDYPLIIAGNRDEFYDRPTRPLGFWPELPDILAGRDLSAGGTWLGVNRTGRIGAITNFRQPGALKPNAPSRGDLVLNFLKGTQPPEDYLEQVQSQGARYSGFNLLVGEKGRLWYYSNFGPSVREIEPGLHGLSNNLLDTPWPKVTKGKQKLRQALAAKPLRVDALFDLLSDDTHPPDHQLPDTGVGLTWERLLSPMFITSDGYGTRCSSVLLVNKSGELTFSERTHAKGKNGDSRSEDRQFKLKIQPF